MDLLWLVGALIVILVAAELFTNGIEWFGRRLNLAEGAVGSVLAAVGTALPETMIPLVAIIFAAGQHDGGGSAHEIGVGAILGAPFMLATLAMFVTGLGVIAYRRRRHAGSRMPVDTTVLGMDIRYFFLAYTIAVAAALVPPELRVLRYAAVIAVLLIYANYVRRHFEADPSVDVEDLSPLRFRRVDRRAFRLDPAVPRLRAINLQVLVALAMIIGGAVVFVDAVQHISLGFGLDPALLALVIAPVATELPEKFNSVIWVRQGKDTLAMGNITGAMVFQSCIPTAIGIILASDAWTLTADNAITFASAGIAFASTAAIFLPMMRRGSLAGRHLLVGGLFYAAYLGLVLSKLAGLW
jgi:cation:H+ antiporter